MIFKKMSRDTAENVFSVFYNASGAAMAAGSAASLETGTFNGVRMSAPASATLSLYLGQCAQSIANSDYGLVQVYGYCPTALVTNSTNQAIAAGDILVPVNAATYLNRSAVSDGKTGFVIAGAAVATATTPAAAAASVFIRAM